MSDTIVFRSGLQVVGFDATLPPTCTSEDIRDWSFATMERETPALEALGEIKTRTIEIVEQREDGVDVRLTLEIKPQFVIDREQASA